MPELPEVETIIRYLRPKVVGAEVVGLVAGNKAESHFNISFDQASSRLLNSQIEDIGRHGKWMLFDFSDAPVVAHLRMSGRYEVSENIPDHPHFRFGIKLENGMYLNYIDQRRFGTFHFTDSFADYLDQRNLGPDALSTEFNPTALFDTLQTTARPVYSALLDQRLVAGLGNIYVNEALHASGIHPMQPANTVSKDLAGELHQNIIKLLQLALQMKGTTLVDNLYQDPEGNSGEFYKLLKVYGKKKDSDIEVLKIGGRSVFVHKNTKLQT